MEILKLVSVICLCALLCTPEVAPDDSTNATGETKPTAETTAAATTTAAAGASNSSETTAATDSTAAPSTGGAYGANCTKAEDCDMSIGLSCNEGECDCSRPKEMRYSNSTNSCTVLESFSCEKTTGMKAEHYPCTKNAACSPKSDKDKSKICSCAKGYTPDAANRLCKGDIGTACDKDSEQCNDFAMLMCQVPHGEVRGKCACYNAKDNIYVHGKCVALAGGACTQNTLPYILSCTDGANCELENNPHTKNTTGICKCTKGYFQRQDRTCNTKSGVTQILSNGLLIVLMLVAVATISERKNN